MSPTDDNVPTSKAVARAMSSRLQRVGDMSRSHAPIDPERELAGIQQDVLRAEHELKANAKVEQAGDQLLITNATQELGQLVIADREEFYRGSPLTTTVMVEQTIKDSQAAGQHVELQKQRLLQIKNSAGGETAIKPLLAVIAGSVLAFIAAWAGMVPLIQRFLIQPGMENADPGAIPWLSWMLIVSFAVALVLAGLIASFIRKAAPISKWLIVAIIVALVARAVTVQLTSSVELEAFGPWWLGIKIVDFITAGLALFILEFGAGAAIQYAWVRAGKRSEMPHVAYLLGLISQRHEARVRVTAKNAVPVPQQPSLVQLGVLLMTERIDQDLASTVAKVSAIKQFALSGAPSGSLFETEIQETNLPVLEEQLALCHEARDRLLRLADLVV